MTHTTDPQRGADGAMTRTRTGPPPLTDTISVISLGAGVQSTTLLLMANRGDLYPYDPVEAVFADTGWEPAAVYQHLDWLRSVSEIPITTVTAGNLRDDALAGEPRSWMPVYIRDEDGSNRAMLKRQCTTNYKLRPLRRRLREIVAEHGAKRIASLIGISLDEATRMKTSGVKYITNRYPFVDLRMTRHDCLLWLQRNGYPRPPKSSCIGCPYRTNGGWREMARNQPDEWADAVEFDEAIRGSRRKGGLAYLHRQMIPLREVDLRTPEDRGQLSFLDECEGMCGV